MAKKKQPVEELPVEECVSEEEIEEQGIALDFESSLKNYMNNMYVPTAALSLTVPEWQDLLVLLDEMRMSKLPAKTKEAVGKFFVRLSTQLEGRLVYREPEQKKPAKKKPSKKS